MYSNGCVGGWPSGAWAFFASTGIVSGGDFDDVGLDDTCTPYTLSPCSSNVSSGLPPCPSGEYTMPACASTCGDEDYPVPYAEDKHKASSSYSISGSASGGYSALKAELVTYGPVTTTMTVW